MSELSKDYKSSRPDPEQDHIPKFIKTLYQILDDKECSEHISWSPDGRAIVIKKPTEFAESLLPVYFKHSNFSSFVRQLNLYNFRKKKRYPYDNTFAHTMFLKGRIDLLKYVKRKNNNGGQNEKTSPKLEACVENSREFDELIGQNMCLKQVHQEMNEKIESLEMALRNLTSENEGLQRQCQKKKQNEEILKHVIARTAKIYGAIPIKEIIEAMASDTSAGRILNWKSRPRGNFEGKRSESNLPQGALNQQNIISHASQYYGYGIDDDLVLKNNLLLFNPFMRAVSSASTLPELSHTFDFYQSLDEKADHDLNHEISYSQVFTLKSGNLGTEDPSYLGECIRDPSHEISKNFCDSKSYDLNPSSSHEDNVMMD